MLLLRFLLFFISFTFFLYAESNVTLQLQWKHQFEFAGFYAAKEKGYYQDVGLNVNFREFDESMNVVDEVLSQRADYGVSYSSMFIDYLQGKEIILLANFFKQSPLVLVTQDKLRSPQDLKGKKIMGISANIGNITLISMLEKFNISMGDIIIFPTSFNTDAFINKKVDAMTVYTTNELYELKKNHIKFNIFDPVAYGLKYYDVNLFTSKNELDLHPDRVKDFNRASIKGWKYALSHKEEIIQLILEKYNTLNKSKEALRFEARQIEHVMLPNIYPIGSIDVDRLYVITESLLQTDYIKGIKKNTLKDFIYQDALLSTSKHTKKQRQLLKLSAHPYSDIFNSKIFWILVIPLLVIGFFLILRNYLVKKYNRKLESDISEKVSQLREKDTLLYKNMKMASMGELLTMIAHQWRQPLSTISSSIISINTKISSGKYNLETEENKRDFLALIDTKHKRILEQVEHLSTATDDLKNIYNPNNKKAFVALSTPVKKALSLISKSLEAHDIILKTNFNDDKAVYVFNNELMQAILNILINAEDNFIDSNQNKKTIEISTSIEDGYANIIIANNGGQINAGVIDDIFTAYFSTKSDKQGTGLGLYIAKLIIEEHNEGTLHVENIANGVKFTVSFPL